MPRRNGVPDENVCGNRGYPPTRYGNGTEGGIRGVRRVSVLASIAVLVLVLVLWFLLWHAIREVRRATDRQTRTIEQQSRLLTRMGQAAGWLPPD